MRIPSLLALAGLAALPATLTAISPALAQPADDRPIIRIGVAQLPEGLSPGVVLSNVGQRITYSVFDQFIKRAYWEGENGDGAALAPSLATEWRNVTPTEWEVDLRTDAVFHDGTPVTAEDVAFTFSEERMWGENRLEPRGTEYFGNLVAVDVVDADTVKFTTSAPDPIFAKRFTSPLGMVVPKAYYLEVGPDQFNLAPIGSGPYALAEIRQHEVIRLVANDAYWGGKPPAREIHFVEVPEEATRVAGLLSGELDIIANVSPDQTGVIEASGVAAVAPVMIDNSRIVALRTATPPMDDVNLRQALIHAIDRQAIVDALWGGDSVVPHTLNIPAHGDLYLADRPLVTYDPDEAKRLLAQSDYAGETLIFRIQNNYYTNYLQAAQVMQQMWADIGINVELQVRDSGPATREGEYHMINLSQGVQVNDVTHPLNTSYSRTSSITNPSNPGFYWSPPERLYELQDLLNTTLDEAQRKAQFIEALDIVEAARPDFPIFQTVEYYGVRNGINWKPYSFWSMDLGPRNLSID